MPPDSINYLSQVDLKINLRYPAPIFPAFHSCYPLNREVLDHWSSGMMMCVL